MVKVTFSSDYLPADIVDIKSDLNNRVYPGYKVYYGIVIRLLSSLLFISSLV